MPQIKFTVTAEAAAYLRWLARNILFEKTENDAARHLMMKQLEQARRVYRKEEPSPEDLTPVEEAAGGG
jgi:hypothetical protein